MEFQKFFTAHDLIHFALLVLCRSHHFHCSIDNLFWLLHVSVRHMQIWKSFGSIQYACTAIALTNPQEYMAPSKVEIIQTKNCTYSTGNAMSPHKIRELLLVYPVLVAIAITVQFRGWSSNPMSPDCLSSTSNITVPLNTSVGFRIKFVAWFTV